ncbi:hypothetical protein [Kitasatospora sp. NPDC047058]|uniref:hypothetical protein n=1 Tax=Kitasatospora sp. NPDC047058 TaxID=3155620 RepID=UPI0033EDA44C
MTTYTKPNQQLLDELAGLSTPEHFGRSVLLSIAKKTAERNDPSAPFELTAKIKVFPAGTNVALSDMSTCIGHINSFGSLILFCPGGAEENPM